MPTSVLPALLSLTSRLPTSPCLIWRRRSRIRSANRHAQAIALQKSAPKPTAPKSESKSADFAFTDVTTQTGLAGAINVLAASPRKRWLLEEIGCGIALFDYDNDGWLDIFMVNGTRFDDASSATTGQQLLVPQ